ncbi:MAG TPA: hypothetical protein VG711_01895 [Phycisphaerales bacterium]|nr:hypothetical protein [Phycisphaerales bacterium]
MPWSDWQFWLVTVGCVAVVLWMFRRPIQRSLGGKKKSANCGCGSDACEGETKKVKLTIGGERKR